MHRAEDSRSRSRARRALLVLIPLALLLWLILRAAERTGAAGPGTDVAARPAPEVPAAPPHADAARALERTAVVDPEAAEPPVAATEAAPPRETLLFGTLLDPTLEPIRGVWFASVGLVDGNGVRRVSKANQDGGYSFQGLEYGSYWISASAEGFRRIAEVVELLPEAPVMRKDFVLQPAVLLRIQVVTPEGGSLIEALRERKAPHSASVLVPVATLEKPGPRFYEVVGSLNNSFGVGHFWDYGPRVSQLPPGYLGILFLDGDLPAWVSLVHNQVVLESQRVEPGQEEVRFVVSPDDLLAGLSAVRVLVQDAESGQPIPGAQATVTGGAVSLRNAKSDALGVALIERLEPGRFDLLIGAEGYERHRGSIESSPGEVADAGTVALEREALVEGRVVDLEGQPRRESFTLGVLDPQSGAIRWLRHEGFQSAADGTFRIRGLGRREYAIRSGNHDAVNRSDQTGVRWVSGVVTLDARAGAVSDFEIRLRPATRLVLRVAEGAAEGLRFRVLDARGFEVVASRFYGPAARPLDLPEGKYRVLLLDAAGQTLSEREVTLGKDLVALELELAR